MKTNIREMSVDDRPREKMVLHGKAALTDAELLAILIGSGSAEMNAIQLAEQILRSVNHDLNELGRKSLKDLQKFKGIGEAKAITIAAAAELGRRRQHADIAVKDVIESSQDAYHQLYRHFEDLTHEEFWILKLNRANRVIGREMISKGGVSGTTVDAKIVFHAALDNNKCSAIILSHNHPSGNLKPSQADLDLTQKLKNAGKLIDISVFDHLIISNMGYLSFADEGLL
jgi:DNA repair protein RadC